MCSTRASSLRSLCVFVLGQNDIKKLRRENEQLRREIWSLRDEYDKLEEILKKQRSREESDEPEVSIYGEGVDWLYWFRGTEKRVQIQ